MNLKDAAEKALHLGKQLQAIVEVGKVLDEIGDLDNAKVEAIRDTKKAQSDHFDAEVKLTDIKQKIVVAEKDFKNIQSKSKSYIDETDARCNKMMADARKDRDRRLAAATLGSEERVNKATQEVNSLQDKRDGLLKEITTSQERVSNLENQMHGLRERLG